ncbi:MAG: hypothetical protein ABNH10_01465 [Alcanivorax sp.]|jgi:AcrR family transcriptional regulator
MNDKNEPRQDNKMGGGRDRLIQAALILASTTRSLASLGLREIARVAGLNPNTFYRHFENFDDFALTMIHQLGAGLRTSVRDCWRVPMREIPQSQTADLGTTVKRAQQAVRASVELTLDHFSANKNAYITGIREIHGSSPLLRKATQELVNSIASDLASDPTFDLTLPITDKKVIPEIALTVTRQMTFIGLEYLEEPERREELKEQAERFILLLGWGALAMQKDDEGKI